MLMVRYPHGEYGHRLLLTSALQLPGRSQHAGSSMPAGELTLHCAHATDLESYASPRFAYQGMADTLSCTQAGGVPVVQDYAAFADVDSFQQRLDFHSIVQTSVAPGLYYIAVYNNDAYFKVSGLQPACPDGCGL